MVGERNQEPVKELKGLKVFLKQENPQTCKLRNSRRVLKFYNTNLDFVAEPEIFLQSICEGIAHVKRSRFPNSDK